MNIFTHNTFRTLLFSLIFVVSVFGVFGVEVPSVFAQAQRWCQTNVPGANRSNINVVTRSQCDQSNVRILSCTNIPSAYWEEPDTPLACALIANAAGEPADQAYPEKNEGDGSWTVELALQAINFLIQVLATFFLLVSGFILWLAGVFLNESIKFTVIDMAQNVAGIEGINIAWSIFRDVANILFIFLILYIAIATILRIQQYSAKSLLSKVVIAALLINFSLFFTKAIIDFSNITTDTFYSEILADAPNIGVGSGGDFTVSDDGTAPLLSFGFSGILMNAMDLSTIYNNDLSANPFELALFQIIGGIFGLVAAFAFLTAGVLLVVRFIVFVLLMATAPVGFVGGLLPATKQVSDKWWNALWGQALFAPAFMLFSLVTFKIIDGLQNTGLNSNDGDFESLFSGDSVQIVLNFSIVIGLMIASIIISKNLASRGAGKLVDTATRLGGKVGLGGAAFLGRQSLGRIGANIANREDLKIKADAGDRSARLKLRAGNFLGSQTYDSRNIGFISKNVAGVDFGKGGKGGIIQRKESAEKASAKAAEEQSKLYGAASKETTSQYRAAESLLEEKKQAYARAQTDKERREAQTELDKAQSAFRNIKSRREAEIQDSRGRTARHEADSQLGGIWASMRAGTREAGKGRKKGFEKAESSAYTERDKESLSEIKDLIKDLKPYADGTGDVVEAMKKLGDRFTTVSKELQTKDFSGPNGEIERIQLEQEKHNLEKRLETLRKGTQGISEEVARLEQARDRGQKKKGKDDANSVVKRLLDEQNKDSGGDKGDSDGKKSDNSDSKDGSN